MNRTIEAKEPFYRTPQVRSATLSLSRSQIDDSERIVRNVSVSSDEPYERYFGTEILSHEPGAIDLSRITAGATPLLFNHSRDSFLGKVSNPRLENGKLYVDFKFSQNDAGAQALADVKDGILTECSIGYEVNQMEVDQDEEIYTGTRWTLYECSIVTVPADFTIGVGRSEHSALAIRNMNTTTESKPKIENQRTASQEKNRCQEIRAIAAACNKYGRENVTEEIISKAIDEDWSKNQFRTYVMENCWPSAARVDDGEFNGANHDERSIGRRIVTHPEARRMLEGGRKSVSFQIPGVRSFGEALTRSTITTGDTGTTVMQLPNVQGVAFEQLVVADLIAAGTTDSGKVAYPREVSFTSDADTVGEAETKPEQTFQLEPDSATAKKIAAWTKISDELLQDLPASHSYVDTRLAFAVQKAEDLQLLNGSGIGTNMRGIRSTPGLQVQGRGADTAPDAIRKAINSIATNTDFYATGIVLYPTDWMNIELLKDTLGRYIVGQVIVPDENGRLRLAPSLWGKPIAISKSMTPGTALVGAFATAAQLFRRMGLIIEMTNCNEDDFVRNLITIRAELRAALAVYNGSAFCEVTGL